MGMYTEIFVNVDLLENTPNDVINTLKAMCGMEHDGQPLDDKPSRWGYLFDDGSYCTPRTSVANLTFDRISNAWSLLGKGDIKNYESEIEQFFDFIRPWVDAVDGEFIGYVRYEEDFPSLIVK